MASIILEDFLKLHKNQRMFLELLLLMEKSVFSMMKALVYSRRAKGVAAHKTWAKSGI